MSEITPDLAVPRGLPGGGKATSDIPVQQAVLQRTAFATWGQSGFRSELLACERQLTHNYEHLSPWLASRQKPANCDH